MSPQWRRRLAYGSNATVVTLIVGAILVLLYVGAMQTRVAWDLSLIHISEPTRRS